MRTILHVDMDAFFASVEISRHPEWRGKPVIVGSGPHERGVVSTCSYEARAFGVRSAMPSRTAYARCPQGVFVPPHMELYSEVSRKAFEVFSRFSPYVESVSIDEAFLDISGTLHLWNDDPHVLGEALRARVWTACGVTCSVGIAPNRLLAKIGSELNKPNGLAVLPFDPDAIANFLASRPLGILWGVGAKTLELLKPYGISTCGDLQRLVNSRGRGPLESILGSAAARTLSEYAFGRDDSEVAWQVAPDKSVSREHTFADDESDRESVRRQLLSLVTDVGRRFRRERRWARTAKIKLRDSAFNTITRQLPLSPSACDDIAFRQAAARLFDTVWPEGRRLAIRLIGFGVTDIRTSPDDDAPRLFADKADERRRKNERLSAALDALRDRGLL